VRGTMASRRQHRGDAVGVQPPSPGLPLEEPRRLFRASASPCGRGSVIEWYASAAASRRAAGDSATTVAPRPAPGRAPRRKDGLGPK
jgi:hypothetical protein